MDIEWKGFGQVQSALVIFIQESCIQVQSGCCFFWSTVQFLVGYAEGSMLYNNL